MLFSIAMLNYQRVTMASLKKKKPRQPFRPGGAVFDDAPLRRAAGRHDTGQWRGLVPTAEGNQGTGETHAEGIQKRVDFSRMLNDFKWDVRCQIWMLKWWFNHGLIWFHHEKWWFDHGCYPPVSSNMATGNVYHWRFLAGKIIHKFWIFHCHVWDGMLNMALQWF